LNIIPAEYAEIRAMIYGKSTIHINQALFSTTASNKEAITSTPSHHYPGYNSISHAVNPKFYGVASTKGVISRPLRPARFLDALP
jgi:hypothetical protein